MHEKKKLFLVFPGSTVNLTISHLSFLFSFLFSINQSGELVKLQVFLKNTIFIIFNTILYFFNNIKKYYNIVKNI